MKDRLQEALNRLRSFCAGDLDSLVRSNPSGLFLLIARSINSRGEIIGLGFDGDGNAHGFLAVPRDAKDDGETAAPLA
jgi:hypothetical protein